MLLVMNKTHLLILFEWQRTARGSGMNNDARDHSGYQRRACSADHYPEPRPLVDWNRRGQARWRCDGQDGCIYRFGGLRLFRLSLSKVLSSLLAHIALIDATVQYSLVIAGSLARMAGSVQDAPRVVEKPRVRVHLVGSLVQL